MSGIKKIYIVTALRYGFRTDHSYTVGVYDKLDNAILMADSETKYRSNKYECVVEEWEMNRLGHDREFKEVYNNENKY